MLSSLGGFTSTTRMAGYMCSKTSVRVLTQCLREELQSVDAAVGVTSVYPGPVRTNIFRDAVTSGSGGESLRTQMDSFVGSNGMEPADVARLTFAAVETGNFWVHTHPNMSWEAIGDMDAEFRSGLPEVVAEG